MGDIYASQKALSALPVTGDPAGGVSAAELCGHQVIKTVLTFDDVRLPLVDEAGVVAYAGLKVYDMPVGFIQFWAARLNLTLGKTSAGVNLDWDGDVGVGTVTASNNNTLAATEQNIIPTTATPQAVAGVTTAKAVSTITEAGLVVDGSGTAVDVYVNLLVDDADQDVTGTPASLILNGTLTIYWLKVADA